MVISIENHVLQNERCSFVAEKPYRQSRRSYVFFVRKNQQDLAVKIPNSRFRAEKEVMRLKRLGHLGITSVAVPQLVSVGRVPRSYILMTRLFGETWEEKYEKGEKPSLQERDRVGTILGKFLAELYRKTGRVHGDLNASNIILDGRGGVGIVDWGSHLRRPPGAALLNLLLGPTNLAPAAAMAFTANTGIAIDPRDVARRAIEWKPKYTSVIATNLAEWLETALPVRTNAEGRKNYLPELGRRPQLSPPETQLG